MADDTAGKTRAGGGPRRAGGTDGRATATTASRRRSRARVDPMPPSTPLQPSGTPDAAELDAAWAIEAPGGDAWTARPWVDPSARAEAGKAARKRIPRVSHATFEPAAGRDPMAILAAQESDRLQDLLPLRHERMAESAFAYYRGTPAVMAFDLPTTPRTDIIVQASGDAHLSNFGLFALARNARSSSMRTTSTRRCPGRGSGTSSGLPRASSWPAAVTASAHRPTGPRP